MFSRNPDENKHYNELNDYDIRSMIKNSNNRDKLSDEVFWFILDNDQLHKKFFIPLARKTYIKNFNDNFDNKEFCDSFMPMVKAGCILYYNEKELEGHLKNIFTKEMRKSLCQRIASHTYDDIVNGNYNVGDVPKKQISTDFIEKIDETGSAQMAGPSGPLYDTSGNNSLSESSDLDSIIKLAGIKNKNNLAEHGSNISLTAAEKSQLMKEHNIRPGTPEWFRLWFTLPYLTNVDPLDPKFISDK